MINQAIQNRRSVREYTPEPVSDEQIREIIKAGQFSPTAINNRSWEFVVVRDQAKKDALYELASTTGKQEAVKNAPVVIIPVMNATKSVLPVHDLSACIENMLLQITECGLGGFWKNIISEEGQQIRSLLGIPENYLISCMIPLGHPAAAPTPHTDEEYKEDRVHWGQW